MADEIDYARQVGEGATEGPWRIAGFAGVRAGVAEHHHEVAYTGGPFGRRSERGPVACEHDARAIALWGSTRREALAVIEAVAAVQEEQWLAGDVPTMRCEPEDAQRVTDALDAYRAAVRRFREAQGE